MEQLVVNRKRKYTMSDKPRTPRKDSGKPRKPYTIRNPINKDSLFSRNNSSMPVSPETQALGWEIIQKPSIYEIVCKSTQRRYVGCSMRPDLRRAVHLYWLKNYWKWGNSNVFFGNIQLARDVEKYGVQDFYLNILKSFPEDISISELKKEEAEFFREHKIKKMYNRNDFSIEECSIKHYTAICEIEPEVKKAYSKFRKVVKARDDFLIWFSNEYMPKKSARRIEINEARENKLITGRERLRLHTELSEDAKKQRIKFAELNAKVKTAKSDLRTLIEESHKKYKAATHCLY